MTPRPQFPYTLGVTRPWSYGMVLHGLQRSIFSPRPHPFMLRDRIHDIVEDNTTRWGRVFDYFIQAMIVISLVAYSIGTLPNNSENTRSILRAVEWFSVIVFTIEYVLRFWVSKKPLKYIFSFYGIIDFIAIAPFYFTSSGHLLSLRALRVFRIFRAFKLVRYNAALNRFNVAARLVKEELVLFLMVTTILLFFASAGIYYFENEAQPEDFSSIFASSWWAVATLTTVGYGDVYPITVGGKLFTFFIVMLGVGIVTIPAGLVASALTEAREIEEQERKAQQEGANPLDAEARVDEDVRERSTPLENDPNTLT